jgi:hypothetical protein
MKRDRVTYYYLTDGDRVDSDFIEIYINGRLSRSWVVDETRWNLRDVMISATLADNKRQYPALIYRRMNKKEIEEFETLIMLEELGK